MASSGHSRRLVGALSATVMALAACVVLTGTAHADPAPPPPHGPNAADAAKQLADAQHDAEALTEQWHGAQDNLQAKQRDADRAEAQVKPARLAAAKAQQSMEKYQQQIDKITAEAMGSGRLDELNALVLSDSPSDFLDQMTTLDSFTADQKAELDRAVQAVSATTRAQEEAAAAVAAAQQATVQAKQAADQITVRKKQADVRIVQVEDLLTRLSPADRAARISDDGSPVGVVLGGSGKGVMALKAAMTRMQSPYVWGAAGPGRFDCSGLVYWAFKKVGITLPRSSSAQAQVGRPVAKSDLQPGDLIFFYSPVTHVGFYAGDGKVLNAVQTGDVVRYTDLNKMKYHSARRL